MITTSVLAVLANPEPIAPGQSPIPVVIIQQHEGMTTGEWWVTVSAFALAGTTILTMIHVDVVMHHILRLVKTLVPTTRRGLPGRVLYTGTDNGQAEPVSKHIEPRA